MNLFKVITHIQRERGLPEFWTGHTVMKADYDMFGKLPKVPKNVSLHKGWFKDTIPKYLNGNSGANISFIHIDSDIYSSTKTILDLLGKKIVKDTIIVFDEYMNYRSWREHEFKAFKEFITENDIEYEYLAFNGRGKVCVRIK